MAQKIDRDFYNKCLAFYRDHPGEIRACAEDLQISTGTAMRAWHRGWLTRGPAGYKWDWARPIKEVCAEDGIAARARLAEEAREAQRKAASNMQPSVNPVTLDSAREDAMRSIQEEVRLIRSTNAIAGAIFKMGADLFPSMQEIVASIRLDIAAGNYKGNPTRALRDIERYARTMNSAAELANNAQVREYRRAGKPTDILSIATQQAEEMTMEDYDAELTATVEAFQRAKEQGLALVPSVVTKAG